MHEPFCYNCAMSLAIIKDHLSRALENIDFEDDTNEFNAIDGRSNCSIGVRLTRRKLLVLIEKDDALPFSIGYGRMSTRPVRSLRIRNPAGGYEIFEVKPYRDNNWMVYKGDDNNPELLRIVRLMLAVFNKAAQRYRAE